MPDLDEAADIVRDLRTLASQLSGQRAHKLESLAGRVEALVNVPPVEAGSAEPEPSQAEIAAAPVASEVTESAPEPEPEAPVDELPSVGE